MKTYWVQGKKDEEEVERLNPLQLSQKIRKASAGRGTTATTATTAIFTPSKNFLSTHPRSYSLQHIDPAVHLLSRRSRSPPPSLHAGSSSPAPSEWPKLDIAIRAANTSPEPESEPDIKLEELQALMPTQNDDSNDLSMVVPTTPKMSDLQHYARIAEENAQKARALADWMAMLATAREQQTNASSAPAVEQDEEEVRQ